MHIFFSITALKIHFIVFQSPIAKKKRKFVENAEEIGQNVKHKINEEKEFENTLTTSKYQEKGVLKPEPVNRKKKKTE